MNLAELTFSQAARLIARRSISSAELVGACLARIEARDASVRAWTNLDPERAMEQARACDAATERGPLHGVPLGVKDIFDTMDFPTEMGTPIYAGRRTRNDAASVALARSAGAVILGKTVTAELAGLSPGLTTNPLDVRRTPGGSSSGSAAAVADFMVPLAFGTQTGGSVLRPASFCGVIGYKPSFGAINRAGLKFAAESLDTIGLIARSLEDIVLVRGVLIGASAPVSPRRAAPRFALCRTHVWPRASRESMDAVENAAAALARAGASVKELNTPAEFAQLGKARAIVNDYERARSLAWEWTHHRQSLSENLAGTVRSGLAASFEEYRAALRVCAHWRGWLSEAAAQWDALITPCVVGEAPEGISSTGDPCFQELWTALYVPTLSLPLAHGSHSMPIGVQFVGASNDDEGLLSVGMWVLEVLGAPMTGPRG